MICKCDNCEMVVAYERVIPLDEIEDLVKRLTPGEPTPAREMIRGAIDDD